MADWDCLELDDDDIDEDADPSFSVIVPVPAAQPKKNICEDFTAAAAIHESSRQSSQKLFLEQKPREDQTKIAALQTACIDTQIDFSDEEIDLSGESFSNTAQSLVSMPHATGGKEVCSDRQPAVASASANTNGDVYLQPPERATKVPMI